MANLNKVMLIGRLTRDPEWITNKSGERVGGVKFGFAVNNRKLDGDRWVDVPVFIDMEIWNRGETKQADRAKETLHGPNREAGIKSSQVFIEGHLRLDEWTDKDTQKKRTKLMVVVDNFQYLDPASENTGAGMGESAARPPRAAPQTQARTTRPSSNYASAGYGDDEGDVGAPPARHSSGGGGGNNEDEIPF